MLLACINQKIKGKTIIYRPLFIFTKKKSFLPKKIIFTKNKKVNRFLRRRR